MAEDQPIAAIPDQTVGVDIIKRPDGTEARFMRTPMRSKDGGVYFLSTRERYAMDTLFATGGNISETARRVSAEFKRGITKDTISKWISRKPHVRQYLEKRINEVAAYNDLTKESYLAKLVSYAESKERMPGHTYVFWKLIGQAKGFLDEKDDGKTKTYQINIRQANGDE